MKIRNGFVSNSSSSSFLLVGFKATKKQVAEYMKKWHEREETDNYSDTDENGFSVMEDQGLLGVKLYIDEYSTGSIGFKDVEKHVKLLKKVYGDDVEIRVFAGTEYN